jgi:type VII secretion-associated serine protease mycosin
LRRLRSAAVAAALLAVPMVMPASAQAYSSQQWALDYLNANQDWQISNGSGVTVAVIDTGVASVPDLAGRVTSGADFSSGASSTGNGQADTDSGGHGTGMAVLIAGDGAAVEGLAPSASILPVRVMTGAGGFTDASLSAGIQYAIKQHVGVINLSLGASATGPETSSAIAQALAANIVVVAASGNETASSVDFPAAVPGVIAVGAIDQNGQIWSQSNTGPQVALAAPGVEIYRDNNFGQQGTSNGTSEATAYVSATAALIRSAHPDWTAGQVIRDLISTATPASGQSAGQHSDQYGYGIISPLKALQASAPSDTSNPLLAAGSNASAGASPGTSSSASAAATSPTSSSGSHTGLIIGIVVGVIVLLGIVLLIILLARRRRGPRPPTGPGSGGYGQPYQQNPYQQQPNPYGQQNPYQQNPYGQGQPPYPPHPPQG